jgi:hypothetical protein
MEDRVPHYQRIGLRKTPKTRARPKMEDFIKAAKTPPRRTIIIYTGVLRSCYVTEEFIMLINHIPALP